MPTYSFKCPKGHETEKFTFKPRAFKKCRCKCGLWATRYYSVGKKKDLHLDYERDPISHLSRKRSFKGIWTENLTPEPVFIKSEAQYQKLLKDTNSREKHS